MDFYKFEKMEISMQKAGKVNGVSQLFFAEIE